MEWQPFVGIDEDFLSKICTFERHLPQLNSVEVLENGLQRPNLHHMPFTAILDHLSDQVRLVIRF